MTAALGAASPVIGASPLPVALVAAALGAADGRPPEPA